MDDRLILMGVIGRPHGVRGLLHVQSYTADPADLAAYAPLRDGRGRSFALRWMREGVAELAEFVGGERRVVADRDAAERLVNTKLHATRSQLPAAEADEFYLADLVGLAAFDAAGAALGTVAAVHDYGAGASLEIGPHLVPFTRLAVPEVDLAAGRVVVDLPREAPAPSPLAGEGRRGGSRPETRA